MYCQRCGAVLEEGVRFCQNCGTRVEAPEPAYAQPEEPAYQKPVYEQPEEPAYQPPAAKGFRKPSTSGFQEPAAPTYEQPAAPAYEQPAAPVYDPFAAQAYEQPAAPVYDPFAASAYEQPAAPAYDPLAASMPKQRGALILPGILAILHTVYALLGWISVLITQVPDWIEIMEYEAYFGYQIFQFGFGLILDIAAGVFLFLFCFIQYRKGRSSMLGIGCLLEAIYYGFGLLSYPVAAIASDWFSFTFLGAVYILLYLAIIAMLVIGMIGAFKGNVNKIVLMIAAALLILMQLISTVHNCIVGSDIEIVLKQVLSFLLNTLLPTALLFIAILWKPAKAE
jgi:hypothetical protein